MKHRSGIIVTLFFLAILSFVTGCGNSTTQTMSETLPTLTDFNGINTSSIRSANGLTLSLSLDAKTYKPGDTINMVVSEWNTLKKTNKLLVSDKWPVNGLSLSLSGTLSRSFGITIFRGDYTAAAIPAVTPLVLYNPNGIVQGGQVNPTCIKYYCL